MLSTFGQLSLYFALGFAVLQTCLPLWGYFRQNPYCRAVARPALLGQCVFVTLAYVLLTIAFGINDFSISYVALNSHPSLPLIYRLTAVWGSHEGSILLWVLILNYWSVIYTLYQKKAADSSLVVAMLGIISTCFLCFLLFTSTPFLTAPAGATGNDLNPLLQDPGFVIHPPMLYIGYVGFSVAFAITLAGLIQGRLDQVWSHITKQFAIAAWCFLTLGITLGSWWAYRVLGWGGFWFWDPVENASLLPWLTGTALIHVLMLAEKRDTAKQWAALLSIICFALSLLGTFLVRSGVLISAHTFANDPKRGVFLLLLLGIVLTLALLIYIVRTPHIHSTPARFSFFSRETGLLINSAILTVAMLTILLGTLYPLILDALHLGTISVGAPYFNLVMLPIILTLLFFMGFGPLCAWQSQSPRALMTAVCKKLLPSLFVATAFLWSFSDHISVAAILSLGFSLWIILSVLGSFRLLPGMSLAHAGFAILIIGVMLSSLLSLEKEVRVKPGDTIHLGPYEFIFMDTQGIAGSNYRGIQASLDVLKNNRHITTLMPEKRIYLVRDMVMTKVAIHAGIFRDLYVALGEPLNQTDWSMRLYYKPFMRWIWFGGIIMMMGGVASLLQRRK